MFFKLQYFLLYKFYLPIQIMKSKIYSAIVISSILAFALIAAIPTTSVRAIVHEGLMGGEDQGGNMTECGETGGMTEGLAGEGQTGTTEGQ
jgi:hypothetical protein